MRVRVTQAFKWAPDGNNVREVQVGEVLEGRGAEVALELKSGQVLDEPAPPAKPAEESPAPAPEAAATVADAPAPATKPHGKRHR